ncbi:GerAB/ArcD/ProY family transporter [Priestia megaterium]|uniref:GerAB/ArcD/ProY family transporter n=1 Tax=Bacillaceae TaxID=186817 RepID=UPI000BA7D07B|nr:MULTISPECIES: endospore germination permease [Bacillaceae]MEC1903558.1 endospore germination permease [Bacillus atrophaeus]MEC2399414.1 endospore germination permease [Bacillus atrophaeus]MED4437624.1 endospore germination permease [Bacillus atrophaeus]MED4567154.1 endospore germination permease [Bacillus atrophaeus]MED4778823.1 endospore germination permease [Bacillus atrophaeus]
MKKRETVSSWQMATLLLAFMTGSTIINIPAPLVSLAKNGAWLSIVFGTGIGMLFLSCILYLHRQYPGLTLVDYSRKVLGKWLSIVIILPFLIFVQVWVPGMVIDIGGFFAGSMLRETPSYVIYVVILFTSALTARAGIEVMARMFVILLYSMFFFTFLVISFDMPNYHPENLLPVLPQGLKPVIHGTYYLLGFPYAELILFSMLLPFVSKETEKSLGKYMFGAVLTSGISLIIVVLSSIMAFGPLADNLNYSLYRLARIVEIADIIERIESIVGISLIAGSYMKTTIVLFVLNLALSQFLKLKDDRILIFPLTLTSFLLTLVMFESRAEFIVYISEIWPLLNFVAGVSPILFITIVTIFKNKSLKKIV